MATYCIGDIQGCFDELEQLLRIINYDHNKDHLWFVGDLVNRGKKSLEVLRLVSTLPNTKVVLGNHDLHLLNFYNKIVDFETSHLEQILIAPDGQKLINWLHMQPLLYYNQKYNCALVHAGIYPGWDLQSAMIYANEAEKALRGENYIDFLKVMYGNEPNIWHDNLSGFERLRFIVNAFTRMRFCNHQGKLEFNNPDKIDTAPQGYMPWFKIPWRKTKDIKIIFGHWAALGGKTDEPNTYALDTGCVWGRSLTALRLDDDVRFSCQCLQKQA
ncbi:MAG: Bis(5'-nucleosyl)-tetraphosphatase (Symmetrical) [uncultured bacterium]|nr:MAG: Bis(5'-nucleosyl)-tetraphosphatase (Symmetrical) [uncultured bacterium]OGT08257.1 MAG: bis(5'-nucleosyl)-tetraphosphatase (symmetrical) [Gammaproteobacteria bacterium RBG_16_37_9]HBY55878.1 diadenosine tetraphosphatase [Coxiellaceae bacterium]